MRARGWIMVCGLIGTAGLACLAGSRRPLATIHVQAGDRLHLDAPVWISLSGLKNPAAGTLVLEELRQGGRVMTPCQIESGDPPRLWWVLRGPTPRHSTRVFRLRRGASTFHAGVTLEKTEIALKVSCGGSGVLNYNYAEIPPPEGASDLYRRGGFIHPLWSPSGAVLTRLHPPDHLHHLGIWGPWTKTEFEGREIDFWNLNKGEGTVRFAGFLGHTSGPVFGGFRARQDHVWLQAPGGERIVLNEILEIRVWNLQAAGSEKRWLVDYTSTMRCATSSPLRLKRYRYGGLGFRATRRWHNGNSDYLTSEGKTRKDGDGTRARWCDVFGDTGHGTEGVLFLSHPKNHEHPEPMRIWPASANHGRGDVFFNFCPVRYADWELKPGKDYVLRYRWYGHAGRIDETRAAAVWRDWVDPPKTTIDWNELRSPRKR